MRKKIVIPIMCTMVIIIVAVFSFLKYTYAGQDIVYKILGGNNLHLSSTGKELFWFDVRHSNDPSDPMFNRIEDNFNNFNPDLVLVEGGFNIFEGNREEAIIQGESAFATYLAKQDSVKVEDIEPPFAEQIAYLQTKYPPEKILAMYLIRQIYSNQSMPIETDFDFNAYLISENQYLIDNGLKVSTSTLNEILNIINSYLPQKIDTETWKSEKDIYKTYVKEDGVLYPIYNDIYNFRNIYLVELIQEKQEKYNKIFIVMGGQHLVDTKAQLEEIYSTP